MPIPLLMLDYQLIMNIRSEIPSSLGGGVRNWGIWASQKLSRGSLLDLSQLQDPRTLGYLLICGLYYRPIADC